MSLFEQITQVRPEDPESCDKALELFDELLDKLEELRASMANLFQDQVADQKIAEKLQFARELVNRVALAKVKRRETHGMRTATDQYAMLTIALDEDSPMISREVLGVHMFEKSIPYQQKLEFLGVTAVRSVEVNRESLGGNRKDRKKDALQVLFRTTGKVKNIRGRNLQQGWIGSERDILSMYEQGILASVRDKGFVEIDPRQKQWIKGHTLGRMWSYAEMHDYACEQSDTTHDEELDAKRLTFTDYGVPDEPIDLINHPKFRYLPPANFDVEFAHDKVKDAKSAIGQRILAHLRDTTV